MQNCYACSSLPWAAVKKWYSCVNVFVPNIEENSTKKRADCPMDVICACFAWNSRSFFYPFIISGLVKFHRRNVKICSLIRISFRSVFWVKSFEMYYSGLLTFFQQCIHGPGAGAGVSSNSFSQSAVHKIKSPFFF